MIGRCKTILPVGDVWEMITALMNATRTYGSSGKQMMNDGKLASLDRIVISKL